MDLLLLEGLLVDSRGSLLVYIERLLRIYAGCCYILPEKRRALRKLIAVGSIIDQHWEGVLG